ncbi:MAG: DUF2807 domain-containing protein [Sphingobacteriaceae bacterium]|nr:DUF2807 domain-containing protein [Sphingobacteriaceae bacterium]
MKKLIHYLTFAFMLFSLHAFANEKKSNSEEREVRDFHGVTSHGALNVIIQMGSTESCRLEGDAEAIADLIVEVKKGELIIRPKTERLWRSQFKDSKVTAYITAKQLHNLVLSGSGDMKVKGEINATKINVVLSGSGTIELEKAVDVKESNVVLSGSGNVSLNGKTDKAKIVLSGSGTFEGNDFSIENLSVVASGSGSVNVIVNQKISAVISGSAVVNYKGDAKVEQTKMGSGSVNKIQ